MSYRCGFQCGAASNEDANYRLRPRGWKIAINPEHKFVHKVFVTYKWDANKLRWPMVLLDKKDRPIAVNDWYKLWQKASNGRRQAAKGYLRSREAKRQQACKDVNHPCATKSHIREIVRKRILELSDRVTADVMELDHDERTRVMSVFFEWDLSAVARVIDPGSRPRRGSAFGLAPADHRLSFGRQD